MEDTIAINKNKFWKYSAFAIFVVLVILIFVIMGNSGQKTTDSNGNSVNAVEENGIQKITIGMKNRNYYPNTITVKAGEPVQITLDDSVGGCYRAFNIRSFGVSAYSSNPSQTIDFTPTQKGTFRFACGMGMGVGTINVV